MTWANPWLQLQKLWWLSGHAKDSACTPTASSAAQRASPLTFQGRLNLKHAKLNPQPLLPKSTSPSNISRKQELKRLFWHINVWNSCIGWRCIFSDIYVTKTPCLDFKKHCTNINLPLHELFTLPLYVLAPIFCISVSDNNFRKQELSVFFFLSPTSYFLSH